MIRSCLFTFFCLFITLGQSINLPKFETTLALKYYEDHALYIRQSQGILDLLSYNTWGLPIELFGHDHDRRFISMADSIFDLNKDIICLQETFHPRLRDNLLSHLGKKYYTFSDYRCSKEIVPFVEKDCFGGLMTLSIYPIIEEKFYQYPTSDKTSIIEKIGSKGFLLTVIKYGNRHINIVNTHLYAGDNKHAEVMRMQQLSYMKTILDKVLDKTNPTFMVGDINIHHPDVAPSDAYYYIQNNMSFTDSKPTLEDHDFTSDSNCNKYVSSTERPSKLDYIFYKSYDNRSPKVLHQSRCLDGQNPMSDHFGWSVTMKI